MRRWERVIVATALGLSVIVLLLAVAVLTLTGTDWGHERIRQIAERELRGIVHGQVSIGHLSGNLLTGMTVHDIVVRDSAGRPFIAVDDLRANYALMDLLHKRIWIRDIVMTRPRVVLDEPPNEMWNYQRVFPKRTTPASSDTAPGWGDWIRFTDVRVINGQLSVRTRWSPGSPLTRVARDSAIAEMLAGGSRLDVERVPGGFQKIVTFDSVTATIPLLRLADPRETQRLVRVSALTVSVRVFRPPFVNVIDASGTAPFTSDSIWWKGGAVRLPGSRISGDGSYVFESGDMTLHLHAARAALADLRWLYPRLPSSGGGTLDFALRWRGGIQDYVATNATGASGEASVAGDFGITLGDSVLLHDTDLRFSGIDTRFMRQVVPRLVSPRRGVLSGHARVAGAWHALRVDGNIAFRDRITGTSRLTASGEIGFPGHGLAMKALHLGLDSVQVDLLRTYVSSLPISGAVSGTAAVDGSTTTQLHILADLDHHDRGAISQLTGQGTITMTGTPQFTLDVVAHPLSLVEVGRFAPSLELVGSVTGPIRAQGTWTNFDGAADLRLDDGGLVRATGHLALGDEKQYDVVADLAALNLHTIVVQAPTTRLTAHAVVHGAGFDLTTMHTTVAADLGPSRLDTIAIDSASVRATITEGRAEVARLYASAYHTIGTASGNFGLTEDQRGTLTYRVAVDSLGALDQWIPGTSTDTGVVPPRPGLIASALAKARADSARIAKKTEIERIVTGAPAPTLHATMPRTVRRDTIGGAVSASGSITGNIEDFDLTGQASGENVTARGDFIRRFESDYSWEHARAAASRISAGVQADSMMVNGFALDTVAATVVYGSSTGHAMLFVRKGAARNYAMEGTFTLAPSGNEVHIADVRLQLDTAIWSTPHAATIRWGGSGLELDTLELRDHGTGRVYANGLFPTDGIADLTVTIVDLPVVDVIDLLQSDLALTGLITFDGTMTGSLGKPAFRATFGIVNGTYAGTPLPEMHGRFGYADHQVVTHVDATRANGAVAATVDGQLPLNLAITGETGPRLLPDPIHVTLFGDSLPLELIPAFTTAVSNIHGQAAGNIDLSGTFDRPVLVGNLTLAAGTITVASTGMTVDHVTASIRMTNDTVRIDSIAGMSRGAIQVSGTVAVANWRDPVFDVKLGARSAYVLDNAVGKLLADGALTFTGGLSRMQLAGSVTILGGVIRPPDSNGKHVIASNDSDLINVIDTTKASERNLIPTPSPFLEQLHMNIGVSVDRDTWVRTHDANIEIYTDDPVMIRGVPSSPSLTGAVTTERGDYTFMSKRFDITRGSAIFPGGRQINPTLQVTGEYLVQVPGNPQTHIKVLIGGTMLKPKLTLDSDAQPPKSQSELLSLLAFGQSTSSLLSLNGSSITGASGSGLVGAGAQFAVQRVADVAMGVVIDEVQTKAGTALGTDYLNITPADVPTEIAQANRFGTFLQQTQAEAGKYLNPHTFLEAQTTGGLPGVLLQYRTDGGWIYQTSGEPRLMLLAPTLSEQPYRTRGAFGAIILRQWRF